MCLSYIFQCICVCMYEWMMMIAVVLTVVRPSTRPPTQQAWPWYVIWSRLGQTFVCMTTPAAQHATVSPADLRPASATRSSTTWPRLSWRRSTTPPETSSNSACTPSMNHHRAHLVGTMLLTDCSSILTVYITLFGLTFLREHMFTWGTLLSDDRAYCLTVGCVAQWFSG